MEGELPDIVPLGSGPPGCLEGGYAADGAAKIGAVPRFFVEGFVETIDQDSEFGFHSVGMNLLWDVPMRASAVEDWLPGWLVWNVTR